MKLTIAIPTYNRNELLRQHLAQLLPQLTADCQLLVIDNHSDVPVAETLAAIFQQFPGVQKHVVRNRCNIGANANILRCFELSETRWLWCLGDDDEIKPDTIRTILAAIAEHPDAVAINFAITRLRRETTTTIRSQAELAEKMDDYSNLLFISTNIFDAAKLGKHLQFGHHYCYSHAPHLALLFVALGEGQPLVLKAGHLIDHSHPSGAPLVKLALGTAVLAEVLDHPVRSRFIRRVFATFPVIGYGARPLIERSRTNWRSASLDARLLWGRYSPYQIGGVNRAKLLFTKLACGLPLLGFVVFKVLHRVAKRGSAGPAAPDDPAVGATRSTHPVAPSKIISHE